MPRRGANRPGLDGHPLGKNNELAAQGSESEQDGEQGSGDGGVRRPAFLTSPKVAMGNNTRHAGHNETYPKGPKQHGAGQLRMNTNRPHHLPRAEGTTQPGCGSDPLSGRG